MVAHGVGPVERNTVAPIRIRSQGSDYGARKTIIRQIAVNPMPNSSRRTFAKEDIVLTAQNGGDGLYLGGVASTSITRFPFAIHASSQPFTPL